LQHARERLVIAREEERRRIRNDLHDGLAPTLSSLQLQMGAVRNLIRQNPEQAETLISELREDMRNATAEIRQLVYNLRPPMLDELGLVGAIRNSRFQGSEIHIKVTAPDPMPTLPAAVEVAAYRIASEALHNVIKHAQASTCEIRIEIDGECLFLKVIDDGKRIPADSQAGVGLNSMKERAAELGGALTIQSNEPSGTCVIARIPIESGCAEV
jgi:two-component system, NarL family, sensor kinase